MTNTSGSGGDRWRQEARALPEFAAFLATVGPLLTVAPKGDGHPVLVMPGLGGDDLSTTAMRGVLGQLGYAAVGWDLGVNMGPSRRTLDDVAALVDRLVARHQRRISLIGWSMGGVFALGVARRVPGDIRQVITLGSPLSRTRRPPAKVPVTSVYSRSDAIVPWEASVLPERHQWENVEVDGSHLGLGHNRRVMVVLADRLAQPDGQWRRYTPPAWARWIGS